MSKKSKQKKAERLNFTFDLDKAKNLVIKLIRTVAKKPVKSHSYMLKNTKVQSLRRAFGKAKTLAEYKAFRNELEPIADKLEVSYAAKEEGKTKNTGYDSLTLGIENIIGNKGFMKRARALKNKQSK